MSEEKESVVFETDSGIPVSRATELSNKLATLSEEDLYLLRLHGQKPGHDLVQLILIKAGVKEYTLRELRVALAMLAGVHKLPLTEKTLHAPVPQLKESIVDITPLPPPKISSPSDETPGMPSVKDAREIAEILTSLPAEDFLWLAQHLGNPKNPRSLFLIIRHHLYRYDWHDVSAVISTLQSILPRVKKVIQS